MSVYPCDVCSHISKSTSTNFTKFFVHVIWSVWSVLNDSILYTSGFYIMGILDLDRMILYVTCLVEFSRWRHRSAGLLVSAAKSVIYA